MAKMKTVSVSGSLDSKSKITAQVREHSMVIDQPAPAGGENGGPTPLEYLMLSLMGCIGAIARIVANQKRIELRGMDMTCSGELDIDVLMGKNTEDRAGFPAITVEATIDADLSLEEKKAFIEEVDKRCPVSDSLLQSTKVHVEVKG